MFFNSIQNTRALVRNASSASTLIIASTSTCRNSRTVAWKAALCVWHRNNGSCISLTSRHHKCDRKQVRRYLRNEDMYKQMKSKRLKRYSSNPLKGRTRSKFPTLEQEIYEIFVDYRTRGNYLFAVENSCYF